MHQNDNNRDLASPMTESLRLHFEDLSPETDDLPEDRRRLFGIMPLPTFVSDRIGPWMMEQQTEKTKSAGSSVASSESPGCLNENNTFNVLKKVNIVCTYIIYERRFCCS